MISETYASQKVATANERNGTTPGSDDDNDTVLNNYNESVTTPGFTLMSNVNIVKSLVSPVSGKLTVGSLATYRLRVDLSEGTTQNVNVTDVLPPGLTFVSHGPTSFGAGCVPTAEPARAGTGQTVNLVYGDVRCPSNGDSITLHFCSPR